MHINVIVNDVLRMTDAIDELVEEGLLKRYPQNHDHVRPGIYWEPEYDGNTLFIVGLKNLTLEGTPEDGGFLMAIPRYADVKVGDCIETNGYSEIFPPGVFIGRVTRIDDAPDGQSYRLIVNLGIDFANLRNVNVIASSFRAEVDTLRNHAAIIDGSLDEKKR